MKTQLCRSLICLSKWDLLFLYLFLNLSFSTGKVSLLLTLKPSFLFSLKSFHFPNILVWTLLAPASHSSLAPGRAGGWDIVCHWLSGSEVAGLWLSLERQTHRLQLQGQEIKGSFSAPSFFFFSPPHQIRIIAISLCVSALCPSISVPCPFPWAASFPVGIKGQKVKGYPSLVPASYVPRIDVEQES